MKILKKCEYCENEFTAQRVSTRYCSPDCNKTHYKLLSRIRVIKNTKKRAEKSKNNSNSYTIGISNKEFLSINEACELLGISRSTINRYIKTKKIEINKLNKKVIIKRKHIDIFLEQFQIVSIPDEVINFKNSFNINDYYFIGEVLNMYNTTGHSLNTILKKNNISKIKLGSHSYILKKDIIKIFGNPKNLQNNG
ncbi:helix-turn-helix domain-containing protein [Lutibacter maritimus]|uniref:DNA binding domain-containing protein, excisionase family n=1 Tax=Lutibacter maritimus TaxID=593133 RepID=A0A1I6SQF1_9FLAO|nr:helix-turn-helix domain-containing protein [Lutibacter maritimus]SFS79151.1 DNA binding domain-containing protein, excisionase family [Lutibacter maritimus]